MTTKVTETSLLDQKGPLVFKRFLKWEILRWSLRQWNEALGDRNLEFRCGRFAYTKEPQWERTCEPLSLSFAQFLEFEATHPHLWAYFDYKHLREHLTDVKGLQDAISWGELGFPDLKAKDSTVWIGTRGAHTPCHVDTYGCNLIAQVYGRKRWVLFPPEENLLPTRVPYEESSVYSKLNLFSPDVAKFRGVTKAMSVVLNPGEVLFLPHGWWHYVENLETAISVNAWIPLPVDDEKRLEESLVRLVVSQFTKDLNPEARGNILNPNPENRQLQDWSFVDAVRTVQACGELCGRRPRKQLKGENFAAVSEEKFEDALREEDGRVGAVPHLSEEEFRSLLRSQRSRFTDGAEGSSEETDEKRDGGAPSEIVDVINAFVDVNVIGVVKNNILRKTSRRD